MTARFSKADPVVIPVDVPLPGRRLATFGHSYNDPNFVVGVVRRSDLYGARLAGLLGMFEDNYCVAGTYAIQGTGNMYDRVINQLPALPNVAAAPLRAPVNVAAVYVGHNDISPTLQPGIAAEPSIFVDFLRASIRRLRAGCAKHVGSAPVTLAGGTWGTNSSASWFGGSTRYATANGWTWTLALPSTYDGSPVEIWGIRQLNTGALHTITVDGAPISDWDTRGATQAVIRPTVKVIAGLAPGAHTIVGTITNLVGGVEHLNYWQIQHPDPPPVAFANVARTPAAANGQSDAVVATFKPLIAALGAEFTDGRVPLIDADAIFQKDATMFGDGTHPSVKGAAIIAEAFADALRPLVVDRAEAVMATDQVLAPHFMRGLVVDETPTADAPSGQATLVAGVATISSRRIQANTRLGLQPVGSGAAMGQVVQTARTAANNATTGTITITSKDPTGATVTGDTRAVDWWLIQPA